MPYFEDMANNGKALLTTLVYVAAFIFFLLGDLDIAADEFLLDEANHTTAVTAPFSILLTGVFTFGGLDVLESNTFAYIIWFTSAVLNSIGIFMLSKRVYAMLGKTPQRVAVNA